jgi:hypothetical protein
MNFAARTGSPVRVTSVTSTMPRPVLISTRRPARIAPISYTREPSSAVTTISTRSPFMTRAYRRFGGRPYEGRHVFEQDAKHAAEPAQAAGQVIEADRATRTQSRAAPGGGGIVARGSSSSFGNT